MAGQLQKCVAWAGGLLVGLAVMLATAIASERDPCVARVAAMVCVAEPVRRLLRREDILDRTCLQESGTYRDLFVQIYQAYPKSLQNVMCRLDRIFIEKRFWASGYAHVKSNAIGVREDVLSRRTSLSAWATWKERLAYLPDGEPRSGDAQVPTVVATLPGVAHGAAFFVVAHELAHMIDAARRASRVRRGRFGALAWSWIDDETLRPVGLPEGWRAPCFYLCGNERYAARRPADAYAKLANSPFVSLYATRNPAEDLAETITYTALLANPAFGYRVEVGGRVFDVREKLKSDEMREKVAYANRLLSEAAALPPLPVKVRPCS